MKEQLIAWRPIAMHGNYQICYIIEHFSALKIILIDVRNHSQKMILDFGFTAACYKWQEINEQSIIQLHIGDKLDDHCYFYNVLDSEFEAWLQNASGGIYDSKVSADFRLKHFRIMANKEMIDILAYHEPTVILT